MSWTLVVAYAGAAYWDDGDRTVERAVGTRSVASSYGRGRRALNFAVDSLAQAQTAAERVRQALEDVRCTAHDDQVSLREQWHVV